LSLYFRIPVVVIPRVAVDTAVEAGRIPVNLCNTVVYFLCYILWLNVFPTFGADTAFRF